MSVVHLNYFVYIPEPTPYISEYKLNSEETRMDGSLHHHPSQKSAFSSITTRSRFVVTRPWLCGCKAKPQCHRS